MRPMTIPRFKPGEIVHLRTSGEKCFVLKIQPARPLWIQDGFEQKADPAFFSGLEAVVRLPRGHRHCIGTFLIEELETRQEFLDKLKAGVVEVLRAKGVTVLEQPDEDEEFIFEPENEDDKNKIN